MRYGAPASGVANLIPLMNSFNKTEAAIFLIQTMLSGDSPFFLRIQKRFRPSLKQIIVFLF